jgi:hypothetical protein
VSARSPGLPDQALRSLLSNLERSVSALEKRVTWTAAVHVAQGGPWGPFVADTGRPIVLQLRLDPGRWVVLSTMSISLLSDDPFTYPPGGSIDSTLEAFAPGLIATRNIGVFSGTSGSRASALSNVVEVRSDDNPIEVMLSGAGSYFFPGYPPEDPYGTFTIQSAVLLAFPG